MDPNRSQREHQSITILAKGVCLTVTYWYEWRCPRDWSKIGFFAHLVQFFLLFHSPWHTWLGCCDYECPIAFTEKGSTHIWAELARDQIFCWPCSQFLSRPELDWRRQSAVVFAILLYSWRVPCPSQAGSTVQLTRQDLIFRWPGPPLLAMQVQGPVCKRQDPPSKKNSPWGRLKRLRHLNESDESLVTVEASGLAPHSYVLTPLP